MKSFIISLIALTLLSGVLSTKYDYESCKKSQCGSASLCGTDTSCQADLNTFYACYSASVNCQSLYKIWNMMRDQSIVPDSLTSCISDCQGPYKTQQVNSYFSCLKNTCLPLGTQPVAFGHILSSTALFALFIALF